MKLTTVVYQSRQNFSDMQLQFEHAAFGKQSCFVFG